MEGASYSVEAFVSMKKKDATACCPHFLARQGFWPTRDKEATIGAEPGKPKAKSLPGDTILYTDGPRDAQVNSRPDIPQGRRA